MDKRPFLAYLNNLKDEHPSKLSLIESIQDKFDDEFEAITNPEKLALMNLPEQYVKKIPLENHNWTSQLHIWAEQCVPQLLKLDPMFLSFKNSFGDTVLMSLIAGATGAFREKVDYDLIQKILETDLDYEEISSDENNNESVIIKNPFDEKDINDQTPIDYLIDFAYSNGKYEGHAPDLELIKILQAWMNQLSNMNSLNMDAEAPIDEENIELLNDDNVEAPVDIDNVEIQTPDEYPSEIYNEPYSSEIQNSDDMDKKSLLDILRKEGFNDRL